MKRILAALLAAGTTVIIGCEAGTGSDGSSAAAAGTSAAAEAATPLTYENGHSLSLPTQDPGTAAFESELLRLVNEHRVARGLHALVDSGPIRDAARAHAAHMIEHRFFAHQAPEGLTPGDRLAWTGVDWSKVGENIAAEFSTPQAVFEAWLASPAHRANLESTEYTHAGVGYAFDGAPSADFPHVHFWAMVLLRK